MGSIIFGNFTQSGQKSTAAKGAHSAVRLQFNANFAQQKARAIALAQAQLDTQVLQKCAVYAPKKTGNLIASGTAATTIGTGAVKYGASYAQMQYYGTKTYRPYNSNRGALWFERMKLRHKAQLLAQTAQAVGARAVIK